MGRKIGNKVNLTATYKWGARWPGKKSLLQVKVSINCIGQTCIDLLYGRDRKI